MKCISSQFQTILFKRLFPIFWFGILGIFIVIALAVGIISGDWIMAAIVLPMAVFMGGFAFLLMRFIVFSRVDEVWDAGHELLVRNGGQEARIPLTQIMNVSYQGFVNPPLVTLQLRERCRFGDKIQFTPPYRLFPYKEPPEIQDLIRRIDEAKRK